MEWGLAWCNVHTRRQSEAVVSSTEETNIISYIISRIRWYTSRSRLRTDGSCPRATPVRAGRPEDGVHHYRRCLRLDRYARNMW